MIKNQIKVGDILQNEDGEIAHVRGIGPNSIGIYINGHKDSIMDIQLHHWTFANPIKNNRVVNSKTFAIRLKQFLEWIPGDFRFSGPHIAEEFDYLNNVANQLLKYQIQTATDEEEISYLKRLNLI